MLVLFYLQLVINCLQIGQQALENK